MALTQDPEQLIEATVQFIGARFGVNTFFKVTADLSPSARDVCRKCQREPMCKLMLSV